MAADKVTPDAGAETHSSDQEASARGRSVEGRAASATELTALAARDPGIGDAARAGAMRTAHATIGTTRLNRLMNPPLGDDRSAPGAQPVDTLPIAAVEAVRAPTGGQPIDTNVRQRVERAVGADLGGVRVHTGPEANAAAESLSARAFTRGHHIFLGPGERTDDPELITHEAVHTVQQGDSPAVEPFTPAGGGAREQEAQRAASAAVCSMPQPDDEPVHPSSPSTGNAGAVGVAHALASVVASTSESAEGPTVSKVNAASAAFAAQPSARRVGSGAPGDRPGTITQRLERRAFARDQEQSSRITQADLRGLSHDLIEAFQAQAYANALRLLAENERIARSEAGRYGEISSGDQSTEANQLRKAAASIGHVQRMIVRRYQFIASRAMERYGGPQGTAAADKVDFYMENSPIAQRDPVIANELYPRLEVLRGIWGVRFPILLAHDQDYSRIADAPPAELADYVATSTGSVLDNIATARERLAPDRIWEIPMLVSYTKATMGIRSNQSSPAQDVIDGYARARGTSESLISILLGALGLILAVGAVVASAGAATPEAAAVATSAFATMSAGASVIGAAMEYERYSFREAQAGSSLDPATALSRERPTFLWLAVAIVGAIADLGAATISFRALARAAELRSLRVLDEAAHAQAAALQGQGQLAIDESKFVEKVMSAAKDNLVPEAGKAEERLAVALDRELEAYAPTAAKAAEAATGAATKLRQLVSDLRARGLDADAIRRVFAEAGEAGKVKGQLLEELFAVGARDALNTPQGIARYARGGLSQGLEFVESHRITDSAGRKFTDGLFGVLDRERRTVTVANIVEAKAGDAAKAKLSREAARLKNAGEDELQMLRESAIDELLDKYHPLEEGGPEMLARQNRFRGEVADEHATELQELMADLYQQGETGQVRRTIERINPSIELETGADIPAIIKIDGVEYKVLGASGSTPVTAVLPSDVGAGRLASTLAKQGLDLSVEKMSITTTQLEAIASRVNDEAEAITRTSTGAAKVALVPAP